MSSIATPEASSKEPATAAAPTTSKPAATTSTQNPVVLELVYDNLITSLSTDVALQIHRWMKTGIYPSSELLIRKSRRDIYPQIYKDKDEAAVAQECQRYAVESPRRKRRKGLADQAEDAKNFYGSAYLAESAAYVAAATAEAAAMANAAALQEQEDETESTDKEGTADTRTPGAATNQTGSAVAATVETTRVQTRGKQPPTSRSKQPPLETTTASSSSEPVVVAPTTPSSTTPPPPTTTGKQPPTQPKAAQAQQVPTSSPIKSSNSNSNNNYLDIYGRAPPKEPKDMIDCHICGRQVNTLRYAPHLDKCMGIGTTVRAAALAASGFVPGQGLASTAGSTTAAAALSASGSSSSKK